MSNGKGSKPRPLSIPKCEFEANWEATFKGDGKVEMELEVTEEELDALCRMADSLGITVDELVERALTALMEEKDG